MRYKKDEYQEAINAHEYKSEKCSICIIIQYELENSCRKPIIAFKVLILHVVAKRPIMDKNNKSHK